MGGKNMIMHATVNPGGKKGQSGIAAVEFAIILPVLILMLLGVIEYGWYFYKAQIVQRTVSNLAMATQQNNGDYNGFADMQNTAWASGLGVVNYTASGNCVASRAFDTLDEAKAAAQSANPCSSGWWVGTPPDASYVPGNSFYATIGAYVQTTSLTSLFNNYIPNIKIATVVEVRGVTSPVRAWRSYGNHSHPAGRLRGTSYKNTTLADAVIAIDVHNGDMGNSGCTIEVSPNGSTWTLIGSCTGDCGINATVPSGYWYKVITDDGNECYFSNWAELSTTAIP